MKLKNLFCLLLALLMVSNSSQGEGASSALTTSFSNMEGSQGEDSSVVFSDRSGSPILKNTGYVAIGTFKLSREDIASLSSAIDLDAAFDQFGAATNFNSLENGAFQGSASGDPAELYDGVNSFAGSKVYIVIGNGSNLITSSEFLVWDSGLFFDGTGPTGGPWEAILSVDSGDLIIGLSDKNTSDFSLIGGDAERGAFTMVMIDEVLDDHGNSRDSATFITENSTTSGKIDDGADIDYFRVDLSEDGNLFVKINQNLDLKLYDGEGNLIEAVQDAGDGLGGGVAADFMISKDLAAGTYYVSIGGDQNTSDVGYNLESEFETKIINLDIESAGSYHGLARAQGRAFVGHLEITVAADGYYTGLLKGSSGFQRSFKGAVQPDYSASNPINAFGQNSTLSFQLEKAASGYYRLTGNIQPLVDNGKYQSFGLFKAVYGNAKRVPRKLRGRYTMLAPFPTTSDSDLPAGDSFASANMNALGVFNLVGYSSSGSKLTYSGPLLETNKVSLYTRPENLRECLLGDLRFRNKEASDFSGRIRYSRKLTIGAYYSENFVKMLTAEGSKYSAPSINELPLPSFITGDNNANSAFVGESFGGVSYPITWTPDGLIKTTRTPTYRASARFNNVNGRFNGNYFVSQSNPDLAEIRSYLRGVVLQKKGLVSGQAETVDNGVGRFSIVPAP